MKLVIREYLSMLKESGELDALLPDLLLSMGITPLSKAQIGVRQDGVDVAGVGPDLEDNNIDKLFLFTIKQGDFSRKIWDDGSLQAIRPSLNEILDVYIPGQINEEHKALPKKVVVCCGGDLKQDVKQNWNGYTSKHTKLGDLEFDLWDGNKLTVLLERFLLDEYLFPQSIQKHLRKTIALADQNEDEPRYFYALIEETLFKRDLPSEKNKSAERKRQKALCLLNLSLNIVFHWCQEADNLRPALLCAERAILRTWDWMRQNELFDCKTTSKKFTQLFLTYLKVTGTYAIKLKQHCFVRDGLFGYGADEVEYPLRTFEVIGILGALGMAFGNLSAITCDEQLRKRYTGQMQASAQMLATLINNNPPAFTPRYDSHAIDIALGLITLTAAGYINEAADWLKELSYRIVFSYRIGKYFPVTSDSYDDLVAMELGQAPPKEELMHASTLLPMLAAWYAVLNLADDYKAFQEAVRKTFNKTSLQLWFPDEDTDNHLYSTNAGYAGGFTFEPFQLSKNLDDLKTYITRLCEKHQAFNNLSCITRRWFVLGLIANRHFRTPTIPAYWQQYICICDSKVRGEEQPEDESNNLD